MAENGLSERVERIEQKLDKQFTEVQEHFVEQRKYIEFAYDKLDQRMTDGFSRLERKFDQFIDTPSRPTSAARRRASPSKRRR
jgi:uncharacterized membrane-anchored protein YhcB (DUF1043 family)